MGWDEDVFDPKSGKHVCFNCIGDDYALKKFVQENLCYDVCDYCDLEADEDIPISADLDDVINHIYNSMIASWNKAVDGLGWDGAEGGYVGWTTFNTHEGLIEELELENDKLFEDICSELPDEEWCTGAGYYRVDRNEIYIAAWDDFAKKITPEQPDNLADYSHYVDTNHIEDENIPVTHTLNMIAEFLEKHVGLIRYLTQKEDIFRLRVGKQRYNSARDLGTKPSGLGDPKLVRMNFSHTETFYGAFDLETPILEVSSEGSDENIKSIGIFKVVHPIKVLDLSRLPNVPSIFDEENRYFREELKFLNYFVKKVSCDVSDTPSDDYAPTQFFSEYIRRKLNTKGLIFPSSKNRDRNGLCCALFVTNEECGDVDDAEIGQIKLKLQTVFYPD